MNLVLTSCFVTSSSCMEHHWAVDSGGEEEEEGAWCMTHISFWWYTSVLPALPVHVVSGLQHSSSILCLNLIYFCNAIQWQYYRGQWWTLFEQRSYANVENHTSLWQVFHENYIYSLQGMMNMQFYYDMQINIKHTRCI